jgi:hypothetical protein
MNLFDWFEDRCFIHDWRKTGDGYRHCEECGQTQVIRADGADGYYWKTIEK